MPGEVGSLRKTPFFIIFFLSGISGLIYEVIWTRQLSLIFGNTVFATSTVLSSFMAGLGIGSLYIARIIDKRPNPFKLYALIEGGIGGYALLTPLLFSALNPLYRIAYSFLGNNFYILSLIRFVFCFFILIIPTSLMGATLPAISKSFKIGQDTVGKNVGYLYGANTFGAAFGCFMTTFILQRFLGLNLSILIGAGINILLCLAILFYTRYFGYVYQPDVVRENESSFKDIESPVKLFLVLFFIMGFTSLAYEVLWVRTLILVFGATAYSFGIMLSIFLTGLAIGSILSARIADRVKEKLFWLGVIEIAVFVSIIIGEFLIPSFSSIIQQTRVAWGTSWNVFLNTILILSLLVIGPPALLIGMAFPLGIRYLNNNLKVIGRDVGLLYAVNTFGAIAGSFTGGFIFIAAMGLRNSLLFNACLNLSLGIILIVFCHRRRIMLRFATIIPVVIALITIILFIPYWQPDKFVNPLWYRDMLTNPIHGVKQIHTVLFQEETSSATVMVRKDSREPTQMIVQGKTLLLDKGGEGKSFYIDGTAEGSSERQDMRIQYLLGHLPAMIHPAPEEGLVIGLGTGVTLRALNSHGLKQIDCIELNPCIRNVAKYFALENEEVLNCPEVNIIVGDGRNHLLLTPKKYDIITAEPYQPFIAGSTNLYTKEFYLLCKERLKRGGVICQWFPLFQISVEDIKSFLNTFQSVFKNITLWTEGTNSIIIGINDNDTEINLRLMLKKLEEPICHAHFSKANISSGLAFFGHLAMTQNEIRDFCSHSPIVTDNMPFLEFTAPFKMNYLLPAYENLSAVTYYRPKTLEHLKNILCNEGFEKEDVAELEKYYSAYGHKMLGQILQAEWLKKGRQEEEPSFLKEFERALKLNPDDEESREIIIRSLYPKALLFLETDFLEGAENLFERLNKTGHNNPEIYYFLGYIYVRRNKFEEGIEEFKKALKLKSDDPFLHFSISVAYRKIDDFDKAEFESKEAIRLNPNFVDAYNNLGTIYALRHEFEKAQEQWEFVLRLDPTNKLAQDNLNRLKKLKPK
jgi:spermidine synthase